MSDQPLNNPFDLSQNTSGQAGALGLSPDLWRSIAMFGGNLAAAANARTAGGFLANGPGLAGPLGAAIGPTMAATTQGAALRSNLAGQQQETIGKQLQNLATASGLPLTIARNQMLTGFYNNPAALQQFLGAFGGGGASAPTSAPGTGTPSGYAQTVNNMEGTGSNPRSSAAGVGQFTDATWSQFAQENPSFFQGMTPQQALAARTDPGLGAKATDWLATKNAAPLAAAGVQPNGPTLAMSHFLGPQAAAAVVKAPDEMLAGSVIGQALGPDKAAQYIQANPSLASTTAGQLKARYAGVPDPGFLGQNTTQSAGGQPPDISAQDALARAQQYEQQANMLEMAHGMGLPVPGDPAALRTAAQQWRDVGLAGAKAQQTAANSNVTLRPGGVGRVQTLTGPEWEKVPDLRVTQNADGTFGYSHITPPLPGAAPGTPGESIPVLGPGGVPAVEKIAPQIQEARNKAYEDFAGKDTDSYIAAQNTHQWLEQMNHAADTLNAAGGFMGTGPTSAARIGFVSNLNDTLRTMGLPTVDANEVASWEELKKATTTAGFELSSHYEGHARQAAQTIINATSAVPAAQNSPVGFKVVSAGIQEAAQNAIDLHEFKQKVYDQGGDLNHAEVQFYQQNPAQMYARRAISTVTPYPVASDKELTRYLPGTFLSYKGNVVQVPARPGAPPIPEYLSSTPSQTQTTAVAASQ